MPPSSLPFSVTTLYYSHLEVSICSSGYISLLPITIHIYFIVKFVIWHTFLYNSFPVVCGLNYLIIVFFSPTMIIYNFVILLAFVRRASSELSWKNLLIVGPGPSLLTFTFFWTWVVHFVNIRVSKTFFYVIGDIVWKRTRVLGGGLKKILLGTGLE